VSVPIHGDLAPAAQRTPAEPSHIPAHQPDLSAEGRANVLAGCVAKAVRLLGDTPTPPGAAPPFFTKSDFVLFLSPLRITRQIINHLGASSITPAEPDFCWFFLKINLLKFFLLHFSTFFVDKSQKTAKIRTTRELPFFGGACGARILELEVNLPVKRQLESLLSATPPYFKSFSSLLEPRKFSAKNSQSDNIIQGWRSFSFNF